MKHGAEGALKLEEKGLISFENIFNQIDSEKIHEIDSKKMSYEHGDPNHHPEISLLDQIDLSDES